MLEFDYGVFKEEEERVAIVDYVSLWSDGYQYMHLAIVEADNVFLYFLNETLEEYDLYPEWIGKTIRFNNALEYEDQDFEDSIGMFTLEEAKAKINKFFGEGEERETKINMFFNNEDLFNNVYNFNN